jgi:LysR family glycine cleavage system transcriptional activator
LQRLGLPAAPTAAQLSTLPLLQQSTRPTAWQQWFEQLGLSPANPLSGPRFELFSMTAEAAAHGLGAALVPQLLVEAELASGALVVTSPHAMKSGRTYYLVMPEQADEVIAPNEASSTLGVFAQWLLQQASGR